jgi:hypothetical protein
MKLDVFADLDHLYMLNFSAPASVLNALVPPPLRLLTRDGLGFPSLVLPRIENLRPTSLGVPRVCYELFGFRILVEYDSTQLGRTKGIYFRRLIMDPNMVRVAANTLTAFRFERGAITKTQRSDGSTAIDARYGNGEIAVQADVVASDRYPDTLPAASCFSTPEQALQMYNDIAYGFLPSRTGVHILQIAEPHPNYVAWPLRHLTVNQETLCVPQELADDSVRREPSYYVGRIPRYWRWLPSEPMESAV